jgi:hypothetical protein
MRVVKVEYPRKAIISWTPNRTTKTVALKVRAMRVTQWTRNMTRRTLETNIDESTAIVIRLTQIYQGWRLSEHL